MSLLQNELQWLPFFPEQFLHPKLFVSSLSESGLKNLGLTSEIS